MIEVYQHTQKNPRHNYKYRVVRVVKDSVYEFASDTISESLIDIILCGFSYLVTSKDEYELIYTCYTIEEFRDHFIEFLI